MSDFDDELLREFLAESREHLAGIETDLIAMEERGSDIDETLVNRVFRAAHSIKGGSGFFGLVRIQELAHKTETALSFVRSRQMAPNPEVVNILLQSFDRLRQLVDGAAASNAADVTAEIAALTALCAAHVPPERKTALTASVPVSFGNGVRTLSISGADLDRVREGNRQLVLLRYDLLHDVERAGRSPLSVLAELGEYGELVEVELRLEDVGTLDDEITRVVPLDVVWSVPMTAAVPAMTHRAGIPAERILFADRAKEAAVPPAAPAAATPAAAPESAPTPPVPARAPPAGEGADRGGSEAADNTLRVNVSVLDSLMNLAGELVLSRNQLRDAIGRSDEKAVAGASQRINAVTSDLQEAVMQARMQPVGNLLAKFHRLVRDLSRALGKEVQLEVEGRDVELDKSLIEGLGDPLTHMVRNAVDHGVEGPDERVAAGKRRAGTVRLRAYHEAGQVVLEVADDGKGIDPERVAAAAVQKGLMTAEKVQAMSVRDKIALIFLPGLSTAGAVSAVSGRGVGMDVVRTNLDRLGGAVEIRSTLGAGTLFQITLPLTLAIMPSLIVSVQGEQYAIPQVSIVELIRVPAEEARSRIEVVGDAEVLVLRGALVPVVRLADVLGLMRTYADPGTKRAEIDRRTGIADRRSPRFAVNTAADEDDGGADSERRRAAGRRSSSADLCVAIVTTGTLQYGLVVDNLHDTEEIVVKPLGRHLRGIPGYAGATIRGDGTVALILDVAGIATSGRLSSVAGSARATQLAAVSAAERPPDAQTLLLFHASASELCALPLGLVVRVERIGAERLEMAGGRRTMQYRGSSLPVAALSDVATVGPFDPSQELAVAVCRLGEREVGVLGALPVDVVETQSTVDEATLRQRGVAGSVIIRDRTVLLTDLHDLVGAVFPDWVAARRPAGSESGVTVLLAEDSGFFRAQVKRFLSEEGFAVIEAEDGEAAWGLLQEYARAVRVVVTDIEMPRLDGLGLTRRIRSDERFRGLHVVGLTSLAGEEDVERGKAAGIDDYQVKLDRDQLVGSIRKRLEPRTGIAAADGRGARNG